MNLLDHAGLRSWLLDDVSEFWSSHIVDKKGGFFEALDDSGLAADADERMVLTQARLTYVFSHAYVLGSHPTMLRTAQHGFESLVRSEQTSDGIGGWPRSSTASGSPLQVARDAYDQAFVIFSMGWYFRASGDPEALLLADRAYDFMNRRLSDSIHGGFIEEYDPRGRPQKLPRRQNPHMHLLEATLTMFEVTGRPEWLERSQSLIELLEDRFIDKSNGTLIEFFDIEWNPIAGEQGDWREPGHHFEWVWLLLEFHRQTSDERVLPIARTLYSFGCKYGIDPSGPMAGFVHSGVDAQGRLVDGAKLLWPQTEFIKAMIALGRNNADESLEALAFGHIARMRDAFFRADTVTWHNSLSPDGAPTEPGTPARVLYHLFLAISEALKVKPR